jgi:peptidoglycan/LPS O-acetylase OafA/YrhL
VVVVFHLNHLRGGFLGVDLFFVLPGYLITSLLLAEHGARRAIDLGRFWVRRARRLLPALFLMLVGVSALRRACGGTDQAATGSARRALGLGAGRRNNHVTGTR